MSEKSSPPTFQLNLIDLIVVAINAGAYMVLVRHSASDDHRIFFAVFGMAANVAAIVFMLLAFRQAGVSMTRGRWLVIALAVLYSAIALLA